MPAMVNKPRIYQLLRKAGLISTRLDAISLLKSGKVLINNRPVSNPDFQVNPKKEQILVDNTPLQLDTRKIYLILNKPPGYLTSKGCSTGKPIIMDLIKLDSKSKNTLFPVGRLDFKTSGLIITTNDGALANKILNPKNKIEKEYLVSVEGTLTPKDTAALENGVVISVDNKPYKTLPAKVNIISSTPNSTQLSITLVEGKKRQVRLMLAALGYKVLRLQRVRIANLVLGNLAEGSCKELSYGEIMSALF